MNVIIIKERDTERRTNPEGPYLSLLKTEADFLSTAGMVMDR